LLLGIGVAMVVAGWLWHYQMPVIKKIWTSSMVLVSSGYCFLLMGVFYYWIDYKGHRKHLTWLKVYGMNSIIAYMLAMCINFSCIGQSLFHGMEQYIGNWYPVWIAVVNAIIIYLILWIMYKRNIFLRV
jgi:predicted acyltransferase